MIKLIYDTRLSGRQLHPFMFDVGLKRLYDGKIVSVWPLIAWNALHDREPCKKDWLKQDASCLTNSFYGQGFGWT